MTAPEPRGTPIWGRGTDVLSRALETDRLRVELAVDAAGIGSFDWDLVTGRLSWDERLLHIFGYDREGFDQTIDAFLVRCHPDDRERVGEALQTAIQTGGEYSAEYRIDPSGRTTRNSATYSPPVSIAFCSASDTRPRSSGCNRAENASIVWSKPSRS